MSIKTIFNGNRYDPDATSGNSADTNNPATTVPDTGTVISIR